ncbi:MAG: LysR family transcriptional regulator [Spongiibacteraceae bacterium]|nr:LysR family transcriptional regulator [Spongiibacteraceae bacterium]
MKSFVAVVKEKSFAGAARSMGISRALVSRQIAELERQLSTRLMNRTTRSISLTESGTRYYEFTKRVLKEIDDEDAAIRGIRDKAEGSLSIISPKWIGILDLGDAITTFAVEQPKIRVRLDLGGLSDRTHEFIDSGYDIAFHTHYLRDSSIKVRKIATLDFVLCASPDYIKKHGEPNTPAELSKHDCLLHPNDPIWHFNQGSNTLHFKPDESEFVSNTYLILQKAAIRDMGVAMLPTRTISNDLKKGRLQILLPDFPITSRPLYAAFSPGDYTVKKVRLFIDFMVEWFRDRPLPPSSISSESTETKGQ